VVKADEATELNIKADYTQWPCYRAAIYRHVPAESSTWRYADKRAKNRNVLKYHAHELEKNTEVDGNAEYQRSVNLVSALLDTTLRSFNYRDNCSPPPQSNIVHLLRA
jgi:hypothetical protein